jgi:AbrB family looped-hinge helix DNA binding protein
MASQEHTSTVTQKGQVTIPLAVHQALGIKPHDRVLFRVQNGRVELLPSPMTLEAVYGAVKPISKPETFEELRRIARKERLARRYRTKRKL